MASNDNAALDRSKPTILVVDTGLDERLIDAVHRRYDPPRGKGVNVVAITTVPADWNGDFSTLTNPRHLNNTNQWLFDKNKVNHLLVVKEDPVLGYPSVKQLADDINALNLNIKGILSHPYNCNIDLEMAELCEQVHGLERYPTLAQVSVFKDKPTANAFLKMIKEKYNFDQLIPAWEATIEGADGGELPGGPEGLKELKRLFREKVRDYEEFIRAENEKAEEDNWEIMVKGKPLRIKSNDPLIGKELKKLISQTVAKKTGKREKPAPESIPWKFFLKPVAGDCSLGAVELSSDLSAEEIDKRLEHHWKELQYTRTRKSILQEFIGGIELGLHSGKNGPHKRYALTIKEMYGSKEIAHTDREFRNTMQKRWEKAIFPVIDKIYEELGLDICELNGDIKMEEWKGTWFPPDFQIRSGFGHPEMKNAVYGTDADMKKPWRGKDIEQLYVAMGLDMGEEDVEEAASELQKINKPQRAVIAATIIPEGGHFLLSNVTDARLEAARNMPGIIDISIPDLRAGDYIPEIKSLITTEGHIFIEAYGKNLVEARKNANRALEIAGVAIIVPGIEDSRDRDEISVSFNTSAEQRAVGSRDTDGTIGRRYKGQIKPFTISAKGMTDAEVERLVHAANYGIATPALGKRLSMLFKDLPSDQGLLETKEGLRHKIKSVKEERVKQKEEMAGREEEGAKAGHNRGARSYRYCEVVRDVGTSPDADFGPAVDAYIKAVAAGFSETERTHPQWNGIVPSYTVVKPRQPATGTRWHNGAKGPEALFRAREDRLARRRLRVHVKPASPRPQKIGKT